MVSLEETRAQLNYEIAVYKEQIAMIKRETERISLTTVDLSNALKAVESLSADRVLFPVGGGAMVKGAITETKVLVPVGAQYMVEMERKQATEELKKRIEATKKAVDRLTEEFDKIADKLKKVSAQMQEVQRASRISDTVEENIREDYI